jgi:RNA polymerase sigma factor for flagellar operon FliA
MDRRTLVELHAPYVRNIAGKIKKTLPKEISFEELYEYGIIGLLEAADRFDPSLGAHFTTFAYYRVRGAIYDGLRGMGWMSRTAYSKAKYESRANAYLQEKAHAPEEAPEPNRAAGQTGQSAEPVHPLEAAVLELASTVHSLAAVYITSLDAATEANLKDEVHLGPEDAVGLDELRALVRKTLRQLPPEERQLLELYYYKDKSMQEVGDDLGLSKSWTSRLHAKVIDKLHRMLEEA